MKNKCIVHLTFVNCAQNKNIVEISSWNCILPELEQATWGNSTVYSDKYGLLSVGGQPTGKSVWNLKFDNKEDNDDWKWNKMKGEMLNEHYYPSTVLINDGYCEKLFVAAGHKSKSAVAKAMDTKVELYDMDQGYWTVLADCKVKRSICGIFYDKIKQIVYIGGSRSGLGTRPSKTVENYDIHKNVWHILPETNFLHEWFPLIWKNPNGILYIASIYSNGLEYIDLRDKYNSWTVECGQAKGKFKPVLRPLLETRFGIKFINAPQESWLLPLM